ncbi:MAG: hypothetical protein Q9162_001386 [Coniocarpon cinnabarinum]
MGCVPYDPLVDPPYHYIPHIAPGVIFVVFFALAMLIQFGFMIMSRKWWYASIWIGALGELMGWAARLYSNKCPYNNTAFTMQISILIIAPCFFSAALYYIEAELIRKWGRQHSLLSAKLYLWIFIGFDLISIAVQGAGGGLASSASSADPPTSSAPGTHTMIGGIVVQLVSMSLFSLLLFYTMWSARAEWLTGSNLGPDAMRMKLILASTLLIDACILARNYYRAVELGEGWDGYLMSHEAYFCIFDAGLMTLVVIAFTCAPPMFFIKTNKGFSSAGALEADKRVSDSDIDTVEKPASPSGVGNYQTRI